MTYGIIADLFAFMRQLGVRIEAFDRRIDQVFWANTDCQRIAQICGVGSKTANAAISAVANINARVIWAMLRRNEEFRASV